MLKWYITKKHCGIDSDVTTIRLEYWVVGLRKMCTDVKGKCVHCRKFYAKSASQIIGMSPLEHLKPAPVWNSIGIDLFGGVNKRSFGKGYGVVFFVIPSTAIHIDIASDYSTDAFLIVFRRFVSIRGCPSLIFSDSGSQLLCASKVLKSISGEWDWKRISEFNVSKGIEWKCSPGDTPWWNGCCESLIKKSINLALGEHRVTFSELQTVFYEAANLANKRAIGIKPSKYSESSYLCPNDLILGRAMSAAPAGPWSENKSITKRFCFIQSIIDLFWEKWTLYHFPHLIMQHK